MTQIINKLREKNNFTSSDLVLSQYILNNTEIVLSMSIYQLSKNTHISTAGIVRFCKKCETNGFKDFKINLARDYEQKLLTIENVDANTPFSKNDDPLTVSSKISRLSIETITATQHLLTTQKLNDAINLIKRSNKI